MLSFAQILPEALRLFSQNCFEQFISLLRGTMLTMLIYFFLLVRQAVTLISTILSPRGLCITIMYILLNELFQLQAFEFWTVILSNYQSIGYASTSTCDLLYTSSAPSSGSARMAQLIAATAALSSAAEVLLATKLDEEQTTPKKKKGSRSRKQSKKRKRSPSRSPPLKFGDHETDVLQPKRDNESQKVLPKSKGSPAGKARPKLQTKKAPLSKLQPKKSPLRVKRGNGTGSKIISPRESRDASPRSNRKSPKMYNKNKVCIIQQLICILIFLLSITYILKQIKHKNYKLLNLCR